MASSTFSSDYPVSSVNNGERSGVGWGSGSGGWNDATAAIFPDSVEITFSGAQPINEIDVFTLQDNYTAPSPPTGTMTFTQYGITAFDAQYWDGAQWVLVPGGQVTGNNLVWRKLSFGTITTTKIRVVVNNALANYSRITEIEAYTPGPLASDSTVVPVASGISGISNPTAMSFPPNDRLFVCQQTGQLLSLLNSYWKRPCHLGTEFAQPVVRAENIVWRLDTFRLNRRNSL